MVERLNGTEIPMTNRGRVIDVFNGVAYRWHVKILVLHGQIDSSVEIDDLADTGRLSKEQIEAFAAFRTFEKGVRGLTKTGYLGLVPSQREDTLTVSFRDPSTNQEYTREEGLDISGLLQSAREDVEIAKREVAEERAYARRWPAMTSGLARAREHLRECTEQLQTLEENSVPYLEVFPHALDGSDPIEKARLNEEARRAGKNPLVKAKTKTPEGDWFEAETRFKNARLLVLPKQETKVIVAQEEPKKKVTPVAIEPKIERSEGVVEPVLSSAEAWARQVRQEVEIVVLEGLTAESFRTTATEPAVAPWEPRSYFHPDQGSGPIARTPQQEATYQANNIRASIGEDSGEYIYSARELLDSLRKYALNRVETLIGRVGSTRARLESGYADLKSSLTDRAHRFEEARVNKKSLETEAQRREAFERARRIVSDVVDKHPHTSKLREISIEERLPTIDRRRLLALLPLAFVALALPLCITRHTRDQAGNTTALPESGSETARDRREAERLEREEQLAEAQAKAQREFATTDLKNLEAFRDGAGWKNESFRSVDYPIRDDFQQRLDPYHPNRDIDKLQGYSVRGLTERGIVEVMNPALAKRATQLEKQGENLPEGDEELIKTITLVQEKIDAYYGKGTFNRMVTDFTERMKQLIRLNNDGHITDGDKIIEGNFLKWDIDDFGIIKWFGLNYNDNGRIPNGEIPSFNQYVYRWQTIRQEIIEEVQSD